MNIELPATLTARYEEKRERVTEDGYGWNRWNRLPGAVVLEFGSCEVGRFDVTQSEHDSLSVSGYYQSDDDREAALQALVAEYLGTRLSGVRPQ